jgi:hypothetical protein
MGFNSGLNGLRVLKLSKLEISTITKNELSPFILTLTYCGSSKTLLATRNAQSLTLSKHPFIFFLSLLGPTTVHSISLVHYILS